MEQLSEYMPYFTSIICALISGIVTYIVSRKQTKNEINKLIKQHELNLESQRKQYEHEIAILNLEHEHQLKLKDKELENKLSGDMMNTLISEAMKNPEIKRQFNQGVTDGLNLTIIKGLKFKLPPIKLQRKFVEIYNQYDKSKVLA